MAENGAPRIWVGRSALERRLARIEAARGAGLVAVAVEADPDPSGAPVRNPVAACGGPGLPSLHRAEGFRARIRATFGRRATLLEIDQRDLAP